MMNGGLVDIDLALLEITPHRSGVCCGLAADKVRTGRPPGPGRIGGIAVGYPKTRCPPEAHLPQVK